MNTMNKRKSPILPMGVSQPESPDNHNTRIAAIRIHALGRKRERSIGCGRNRIVNARIKAVFAVTDPIALPAAISACPDSAAITDTKISGKVVATETMVAPMMNGGIPDADAIHAAASTKRSPPRIMQNSPSANSRNTKNVLMKPPQIHIKEKSLTYFYAKDFFYMILMFVFLAGRLLFLSTHNRSSSGDRGCTVGSAQ